MDTNSGYDNKLFWDKYKNYIKECYPRHFKVTQMLRSTSYATVGQRILDLGSGACKESKSLFWPSRYFGVDANVDPKEEGILCDYRKDFDRILKEIPFSPQCFTSIFSSELTAPQEENYSLYERLFRTFSSIKWGIVSGFYYGSKRNEKVVKETGGLESYQSILDLSEIKSSLFREIRIQIPGPSKMFGDDVIEVWKLLERK